MSLKHFIVVTQVKCSQMHNFKETGHALKWRCFHRLLCYKVWMKMGLNSISRGRSYPRESDGLSAFELQYSHSWRWTVTSKKKCRFHFYFHLGWMTLSTNAMYFFGFQAKPLILWCGQIAQICTDSVKFSLISRLSLISRQDWGSWYFSLNLYNSYKKREFATLPDSGATDLVTVVFVCMCTR